MKHIKRVMRHNGIIARQSRLLARCFALPAITTAGPGQASNSNKSSKFFECDNAMNTINELTIDGERLWSTLERSGEIGPGRAWSLQGYR